MPFQTRRTPFIVLCALISATLGGCTDTSENTRSGDGISGPNSRLIAVNIEKRDPKPLLEFYLNSFASEKKPGLVAIQGKFYADLDVINTGGPELRDENDDDEIDWEELESFVLKAYYERRGIPESISGLQDRIGQWSDLDGWFRLAVTGVMTSARREIHVRDSSLALAIESFADQGQLLYPIGTSFVAEHFERDDLKETTVMIKRADGLWDYAAYDSTGTRTTVTRRSPKSYSVPTQCLGCHFGNRGFEPERSYPKPARPGPNGERVFHFPEVTAPPELVALFDEHMRRSDTVLGLYATLYVAGLSERPSSDLSPREIRVLELVR